MYYTSPRCKIWRIFPLSFPPIIVTLANKPVWPDLTPIFARGETVIIGPNFSGKIDEVEIYNCLALPPSLSPGDFNKDGIVSLHDFAFLAANWLKFVFAD